MPKSEPLTLRRENGKCITVEYGENSVPIIVWRKNKAPQLVLVLTRDEARTLREMLRLALG
jgi:hypothetical protein